MSSSDRHVDAVLRPESHFPDVLLRMAENAEKTCPFLTPEGCRVYPDRPDTCRTFPLEQGLRHDAESGDGRAGLLLPAARFLSGAARGTSSGRFRSGWRTRRPKPTTA
ncbi:MAG: YkgJ family cysteine cluster protein [Desulfosudis oleivorans]|nr:YkgJ family cysteine cluster protein [Desulfosudis oleivorans]